MQSNGTESDASISRRNFLKSAGEGAAAAAALSTLGSNVFAAESKRKPNIVYVFPDQHRQCSWSLTDPQVKTPNLQALAAESLVFNRCITTYPLCSPHRGTMLTGRYPQSHTVTANGLTLPTTEVTIADVLKQAGYATGYVGKWHLHADTESLVPPGPHRHGFDYWRVCTNYRKRYNTRYFDDAGKSVKLDGYAPKCQMDLTLEFIEKHAHEPFCVFLSWHPPHPPYDEAPPEYAKLYDAEKIHLRPNVTKDARKVNQKHVEYFAHVSAEDAEMGRLMKKLADLGIADDTILCFTSDHGDMLGSRGRFGKNVPWDESINVPFILRYPGVVPAGKTLDTLFSTVDIVPTLLGLAGVRVPPSMEGTDLSAIVRGEKTGGPESAFIMSSAALTDAKMDAAEENAAADELGSAGLCAKAGGKGGRHAGWRGVRTARYTFVKQGPIGSTTPVLLYDNETDPHQLKNLVGNADLAKVQSELDAMLNAYLKRLHEA